MLPALQMSRTNPAEVLREDGPRALGGRSRRRLHSALVVAEIALAVILLSGAGLLTRSFLRVQATDRGFDFENVLLLQVDLPGTYDNAAKISRVLQRRDPPDSRAAGRGRRRRRERLLHPSSAGLPRRRGRPAGAAARGSRAAVDRRPGHPRLLRSDADARHSRTRARGRDLAQGAPPVIVINEEMARRFWPGEEPLGKRLKYGLDPASKNPWKTVVGVVADMRRQRLDERAIPYMFQPGINSEHGHRHSRGERPGPPARAHPRGAARARSRWRRPTASSPSNSGWDAPSRCGDCRRCCCWRWRAWR